MTSSAPSDRTRSTFVVLHTPVTSAPKALAICTANDPTPPAAKSLERRAAGGGNRRRLLEGEVRRLGRQPVLARSRVLGEGASAGAEHLIAQLELRDPIPDRLDATCHIG